MEFYYNILYTLPKDLPRHVVMSWRGDLYDSFCIYVLKCNLL